MIKQQLQSIQFAIDLGLEMRRQGTSVPSPVRQAVGADHGAAACSCNWATGIDGMAAPWDVSARRAFFAPIPLARLRPKRLASRHERIRAADQCARTDRLGTVRGAQAHHRRPVRPCAAARRDFQFPRPAFLRPLLFLPEGFQRPHRRRDLEGNLSRACAPSRRKGWR